MFLNIFLLSLLNIPKLNDLKYLLPVYFYLIYVTVEIVLSFCKPGAGELIDFFYQTYK